MSYTVTSRTGRKVDYTAPHAERAISAFPLVRDYTATPRKCTTTRPANDYTLSAFPLVRDYTANYTDYTQQGLHGGGGVIYPPASAPTVPRSPGGSMAVDTARQKSKWKPAPPPTERRIQEPEPEEAPA